MRIALLLVAALLLGAAPPPATVTVTLLDYRFEPAAIRLVHGQAYVLHLVNGSHRGHNFVAPRFLAAARLDPRPIEVAPDSAVDVALTAPAAGLYPVKCSHFTHAMRGMKGEIVVA